MTINVVRHRGASIIFFSSTQQVLLMLRDNIPTIPFPGMWDIPGGHIEENETAQECIVREMLEEMELPIEGYKLFGIYEFSDRTEYIFTLQADFDTKKITLHEGQKIQWFTQNEVNHLELAYGFNEVLADFYQKVATV